MRIRVQLEFEAESLETASSAIDGMYDSDLITNLDVEAVWVNGERREVDALGDDFWG